jgi:hypothetical protein
MRPEANHQARQSTPALLTIPRRVLVAALLRSFLSVLVVVTIYFVIPLDHLCIVVRQSFAMRRLTSVKQLGRVTNQAPDELTGSESLNLIRDAISHLFPCLGRRTDSAARHEINSPYPSRRASHAEAR